MAWSAIAPSVRWEGMPAAPRTSLVPVITPRQQPVAAAAPVPAPPERQKRRSSATTTKSPRPAPPAHQRSPSPISAALAAGDLSNSSSIITPSIVYASGSHEVSAAPSVSPSHGGSLIEPPPQLGRGSPPLKSDSIMPPSHPPTAHPRPRRPIVKPRKEAVPVIPAAAIGSISPRATLSTLQSTLHDMSQRADEDHALQRVAPHLGEAANKESLPQQLEKVHAWFRDRTGQRHWDTSAWTSVGHSPRLQELKEQAEMAAVLADHQARMRAADINPHTRSTTSFNSMVLDVVPDEPQTFTPRPPPPVPVDAAPGISGYRMRPARVELPLSATPRVPRVYKPTVTRPTTEQVLRHYEAHGSLQDAIQRAKDRLSAALWKAIASGWSGKLAMYQPDPSDETRLPQRMPAPDLVMACLVTLQEVGRVMVPPLPAAIEDLLRLLNSAVLFSDDAHHHMAVAAEHWEQICQALAACQQSWTAATEEMVQVSLATSNDVKAAEIQLKRETDAVNKLTDELETLRTKNSLLKMRVNRQEQELARLPVEEAVSITKAERFKAEAARIAQEVEQPLIAEFAALQDHLKLLSTGEEELLMLNQELAHRSAVERELQEKVASFAHHISVLQSRFDKDMPRVAQLQESRELAVATMTALEHELASYSGNLTPRPNWEPVHEALPQLSAEIAADPVAVPAHLSHVTSRRTSRRSDGRDRSKTLASETSGDGASVALSDMQPASRWGSQHPHQPLGTVPENERVFPSTRRTAAGMVRLLQKLMVNEDVERELEDLNQKLEPNEKRIADLRKQLEEMQASLPAGSVLRTSPEPSASKDPKDAAGDVASKYFVGLGMGAHVPRFLRFNGKVRYRDVRKSDLEILIRQVWKDKVAYEASQKATISLVDYFFVYLRKRFGIQPIVAEWGYNLIHAIEKYVYDADVELFLMCLAGAVPEAAYYDQQNMLVALARLCERLEDAYGGKRYIKYVATEGGKASMLPVGGGTGLVRRCDVVACLYAFFPKKSETYMNTLIAGLDRDGAMRKGDRVQHRHLFGESETGDQSDFLESLRDQYLAEIHEHMSKLRQLLQVADRKQSGQLTVLQLRDVLRQFDSQMSRSDANVILARALHVEVDEMQYEDIVSIESIYATLKSLLVKRGLNYVSSAIPVLVVDGPTLYDAPIPGLATA